MNTYMAKQIKILREAYSYLQLQDMMKLHQDRLKELYDWKRHGKPFEVSNQVMLHSTVFPWAHGPVFAK